MTDTQIQEKEEAFVKSVLSDVLRSKQPLSSAEEGFVSSVARFLFVIRPLLKCPLLNQKGLGLCQKHVDTVGNR